MTVTNALCTEEDVRSVVLPSGTAFPDSARIELAINSASRLLEEYTGRVFTKDTEVSARYFVAPAWNTADPQLLDVDDFYDSTGLIIETGDSIGNWTTLDTALVQLEPLNGRMSGQAWPYTGVRALAGYRWPHLAQQALVRLTALWGWASVPEGMRAAAVAQVIANFKAPENPLGYGNLQDAAVPISRYLHPNAKLLAFEYCKNPYGA